MYSLAGLMYTGMAEMYCNGMPVSDATLDGTLTFSDPLTTTAVYNRAVDRFDSALKYFGTNANISLAKVGLARTLLDLNQPAAAAAAAVAGMPTALRLQPDLQSWRDSARTIRSTGS